MAGAPLAEAFVRCRDMEGSLQERLDAYSRAVKEHLPVYAEAVDRLVERLSIAGAGSAAPRLGEPMPPFVLPDEQGRLVSMDELLRHGPLAITFHRGHWCPWCRISGRTLARAHTRMAGAGMVAVMPDREQFAAQFKAGAQSPFAVLTDPDNGYALSLNLAIWVGPDLVQLLSSLGRSLPDYQVQRRLDAADPSDLCDRAGRRGARALCRSRFSSPNGSGGSAPGAARGGDLIGTGDAAKPRFLGPLRLDFAPPHR